MSEKTYPLKVPLLNGKKLRKIKNENVDLYVPKDVTLNSVIKGNYIHYPIGGGYYSEKFEWICVECGLVWFSRDQAIHCRRRGHVSSYRIPYTRWEQTAQHGSEIAEFFMEDRRMAIHSDEETYNIAIEVIKECEAYMKEYPYQVKPAFVLRDDSLDANNLNFMNRKREWEIFTIIAKFFEPKKAEEMVYNIPNPKYENYYQF